MEMKRIYEVYDTYDAFFNICSYLTFVVLEVLIWFLVWFIGYVSDKRAKASDVYCFFVGLVMGESSCYFIVAITYVGQKAYLQKNSSVYWDVEGSTQIIFYYFVLLDVYF